MPNLQPLLDEAAITRMIHDYAARNDAGDWDEVAALYVPEGRMSRPIAPDDFVEGRDAILAAFKARPPRTTRHICTNIRVDVEGDTASASSQIMLFTAAGQPPLVGSYADRLVRTADGWRFVERRGSLDFPA
ncbi:MAG TPA: nuclear transport factor 2 family protein [Chakrabartia sp.]|nr:nuclear transport factor 2 family protein [Chakrabartia sp.]